MHKIYKYQTGTGASGVTGNDAGVNGSTDGPGGFTAGSTPWGMIGSAANQMVLSPISNAAFQNSRYADDGTAVIQQNVRNNISDAAIKSGNPIAMAIGAAAKLIDAGMDATGARSDNIHKDAAEKAGVSGFSRFMNNSMNFLPGNPLAMGGKKTTSAEKDIETENVRSAYTDTLDDIDTAAELGGKRFNAI